MYHQPGQVRERQMAARRRVVARSEVSEEAIAAGPRGPAQVLAMQRLVGNRATAAVLREPVRVNQERDLKEEQRRDDRRDRGRREGDPLGGFDTDWAGRVLLAHYLYGGGDKMDIWHDSDWTGYMTRSERLREQNMNQVIAIVVDLMKRKQTGKLPVYKKYHAEVENGEGMVGYQYLHGTNKTVGDFEIWGTGTVSKVDQAGVAMMPGSNPYAPDVEYHEAGTRIDLELTYQWNDIIDPNGKYISDLVKDYIAQQISFYQAEGYAFSVAWKDKCTVFVAPNQDAKVLGGYPTK
jgi:hypothetical protein